MNTLNTMIADIIPKDLFLVDLVQDKSKIKVIVDGVKPIDLDTTAYIAKKIRNSDSLNKLLPEEFQLEVSSPGIDAPLQYPFQYEKNIGRQLKIRELNKMTSISIELDQVTKDGIVGKSKKGEKIKYNFNEIESATIITVF